MISAHFSFVVRMQEWVIYCLWCNRSAYTEIPWEIRAVDWYILRHTSTPKRSGLVKNANPPTPARMKKNTFDRCNLLGRQFSIQISQYALCVYVPKRDIHPFPYYSIVSYTGWVDFFRGILGIFYLVNSLKFALKIIFIIKIVFVSYKHNGARNFLHILSIIMIRCSRVLLQIDTSL